MLEGFEIRGATEEEYFSVVSEPKILARIHAGNGGIDPVYKEGYTYLLTYREYRLVATLEEVKEGAGYYEVHIACPADSIRASRLLALAGIQWFATTSTLKWEHEERVKGLITSCGDTEGKIFNYLKKLGFRVVKRIEDKLYFMLDIGERI